MLETKEKQKKKLSLAVQIFIALVAGVDRVFDMGRTTVNITGDASCVIVVSNLLKNKLKAWANPNDARI